MDEKRERTLRWPTRETVEDDGVTAARGRDDDETWTQREKDRVFSLQQTLLGCHEGGHFGN